jgi:ankyrin repeat protein
MDVNLEMRCSSGCTALHYAIRHGCFEVCKYLIRLSQLLGQLSTCSLFNHLTVMAVSVRVWKTSTALAVPPTPSPKNSSAQISLGVPSPSPVLNCYNVHNESSIDLLELCEKQLHERRDVSKPCLEFRTSVGSC